MGERKLDKASLVVYRMLSEESTDTLGCFWILGNHVEETTPSCTWKFITKAVVMNLLDNLLDRRRISSGIKSLVESPTFPH